MMLNSMWGKFGQKTNKTQVGEFDDPVTFSNFHESDKYDIYYVSVLTENRVEIHFKHELEDDHPTSTSLWPASQHVGPACVCMKPWTSCKTGCCTLFIFLSRPREENPKLGDYLGEECKVRGISLNSEGIKQLNYQVLRQNVCDDVLGDYLGEECKVRGISLNSEGIKQLNYQVLRQNVCDNVLQPLENRPRQTAVVKPYHIVRNVNSTSLKQCPRPKSTRWCSANVSLTRSVKGFSRTRTVTLHGSWRWRDARHVGRLVNNVLNPPQTGAFRWSSASSWRRLSDQDFFLMFVGWRRRAGVGP